MKKSFGGVSIIVASMVLFNYKIGPFRSYANGERLKDAGALFMREPDKDLLERSKSQICHERGLDEDMITDENLLTIAHEASRAGGEKLPISRWFGR